jgi:hypothetical protein
MVFGQSPRIGRAPSQIRREIPYRLAQILADWAKQRDIEAPVHPQEDRVEVNIAGENGGSVALFFLTEADINLLADKLGA